MLDLIATISCMVLGVVTLSLFLIQKCRGYTVKELIFKAATSLLFIATALFANYHSHNHSLGVFVILGLACGMLGDVWLDLKYIFKEKDKVFTYAGFISFALGHVSFMTGFIVHYLRKEFFLFILLPVILGLAIGALPLLLHKVMKLDFKDMKIITYIYSSLLFMMTLMGLSCCIATGFKQTTPIMLFIGGLLFTISDLILSGTYFGENHEQPFDIISNGLTYYMAQFTIAFSLFFL